MGRVTGQSSRAGGHSPHNIQQASGVPRLPRWLRCAEGGDLNVVRKDGCKVMGGEAVEIITGHERRRRWSVANKLRILAECDEPGAKISAVAVRHGVCRSLVFQRRRQARDGLLVA